MIPNYNNYNKFPHTSIAGYEDAAWEGYDTILSEVKKSLCALDKKKLILVLDFYPGVNEEEVLQAFSVLKPSYTMNAEDCTYQEETVQSILKDDLTEDRIFGILTTKQLPDFFSNSKIEAARTTLEGIEEGLVLLFGVGASLISKGDILIYFDLARWEIQQRFRNGMSNWKANNHTASFQAKYKRGYFVEWRLADRHKRSVFSQIDYFIDTNKEKTPKMVTGDAIREGLQQVSQQPFRLVPYFDPGVWGGQWMKKVCNLSEDSINYAWSFDGVPEENSIYLKYGEIILEIPSIDVVFFEPKNLLGDRVYSRFGCEFPIRFDFLDTMGGGNLSLQVHPLSAYIKENFGMEYTQDESYYILDCEEDACVYLGVKEGIDKHEMIKELKEAEKGEAFPIHKYINQFPVKKHDHFLIPAGTIHCSGKNSMVLEISATPYIFTFKLWDWDRVGLDGLPRPIHIMHGEKVIQWDRDTRWVQDNLIDQVELLAEDDGVKIEKTGLHEAEFIETVRHWFTKPVLHKTHGSVNVLNLVEGSTAIIMSPKGKFDPFIVHYAETFIIPACVDEYEIRPYGESKGKQIATIKAFVR